jgi:hypothetical protein
VTGGEGGWTGLDGRMGIGVILSKGHSHEIFTTGFASGKPAYASDFYAHITFNSKKRYLNSKLTKQVSMTLLSQKT